MGKFSDSLREVQEVMQESEDELSNMMDQMAGPSTQGMTQQHPPKLLELIEILQNDPFLIPPILELVKIKQAEIMDAKGRLLYGDAQWNEMKERMRQQQESSS